MATGIFPLFFLIICFLVRSSDGQTNLTAEVGENATLPCKVPNNIITSVVWRRPDLLQGTQEHPDYVLVYRSGHFDPDNQNSSYQNRVDLQDKDMKDGDVSMILMNVTKNDTGIYMCRVFEKGKIDLISIINLEVRLPGNKDEIVRTGGDKDGGNKTGIIVGSVVGVILLVASLGFLIYKRHMKKNPHLPVPPVEPPAVQMSTLSESPAEPATASVPLMEPSAEEQPTEM